MEAEQHALDTGIPPSPKKPRKESKAKEEAPVIRRFG